jgi:hypothetical protein
MEKKFEVFLNTKYSKKVLLKQLVYKLLSGTLLLYFSATEKILFPLKIQL